IPPYCQYNDSPRCPVLRTCSSRMDVRLHHGGGSRPPPLGESSGRSRDTRCPVEPYRALKEGTAHDVSSTPAPLGAVEQRGTKHLLRPGQKALRDLHTR